MLLIDCPYCGSRSDAEFVYGEDASISHHRMAPDNIEPGDWTGSVYLRDNPNGPHREYWFHRDGCRKWLLVQRNTGTNQVISVTSARYSEERT